jgi:SARP family transcriptional regulator, regulator of embCAB operon
MGRASADWGCVMSPRIHRRIDLPDREDQDSLQLSLLGAFELSDRGESVVLSGGTQRLLAFVALQERPTSRDVVAEALWPDVSESQSHARLRSAIWRLEQAAREAMSIDVLEIELSAETEVDVRDAKALARRILFVDTMPSEGDITTEAIAALSAELLPDWYDDWAVIRAEDWRQLRLHALESLAEKLLDVGRFSDALEAASAARQADLLRESPHALTIRIHLAEGNQSEAIRAFLAYRKMLRAELGIEPTPRLWDLIRDLMP